MTWRAWLAVVALALGGCAAAEEPPPATTEEQLRGVNQGEALADLSVLEGLITAHYAPLEYKRDRFGFDLTTEIATARKKIEAATTEPERVRPFYELLAKLRDGHVGLLFPVRADESPQQALAISVTPIGEDYYVSGGNAELGRYGDRVVSIDGLTTKELEARLLPLCEIGTLESSRHRVAQNMTVRPFYAGPERCRAARTRRWCTSDRTARSTRCPSRGSWRAAG